MRKPVSALAGGRFSPDKTNTASSHNQFLSCVYSETDIPETLCKALPILLQRVSQLLEVCGKYVISPLQQLQECFLKGNKYNKVEVM